MSDIWDYRLSKLDIAWELAKFLMPTTQSGERRFISTKEALQKAKEAIDTVFPEPTESTSPQKLYDFEDNYPNSE